MGTITLPNVRATSDINAKVRLKYGGMPIDFRTLYDIKAWIYSDAQKAIAGRCVTTIEGEEGDVLSCLYAATKPQYLGINRIIVQAKYHGQTSTYDKAAFNIVKRDSDLVEQVAVVDDTSAEEAVEVSVSIEITEVSAGLLDRAIAAAIEAAGEAEHAAHLVPLQVLKDCEAATIVALTAAEKAPIIGENGNWWVWNSKQHEYVDTGYVAKGDTGIGIANVEQTTRSNDDAGTNVITVTMTDGTIFTFYVKNGSKGIPGVAQAAYKSVQTLPEASADTMDMIYLTPTETEDEFNMSYTEFDGESYTWKSIGTTAIQLSDYATKDEVVDLQKKKSVAYSFPVTPGYGIIIDTGIRGESQSRAYTDYIDISGYNRLVYTRHDSTSSLHAYGTAFYDANKAFISGVRGGINAEQTGYSVRELAIPDGAVYARFTLWANPAYGDFWFCDPTRDAQEKRIEKLEPLISKYNVVSSFDVIEGRYVDTQDGVVPENNSRSATDFIDITAYRKLVYTRIATPGSHTSGMAFYNENKEFISGVRGIDNSGNIGYVLEEADVPEGAVYARFTLWKNPAAGRFFIADAIGDADEHRAETLSDMVSVDRFGAINVKLDGKGQTYVYGDAFYAKPKSVLRFRAKNPDAISTATAAQAKLQIGSYDSENNGVSLLRIAGDETIQDEYTIVVPDNSAYLRLNGRFSIGYSVVFNVEDITGEYNDVRLLTGGDFSAYLNAGNWNSRADARFELKPNSLLYVRVVDSSMPFEYQVNRVVVNSDHTVTNNIISSWSKNSFLWKFGDEDYCRIQLRKTDGTNLEPADYATFLEKAVIIVARNLDEAAPNPDEEHFTPYGFSRKTDTSVMTNYLAKPKQEMKLRVKLPAWLGVQLTAGLRDDRETSSGYFNGDVVSLEKMQGAVSFLFTPVDGSGKRPAYYKSLVESGDVAFVIEDAVKDSVIKRNYDAEKYLGAIRTTPGVAEDLPVFVHTSDIHGDAVRLKNVLEYAAYLGAACVFNTGDNPFYLMGDGVTYLHDIVLSQKTDFATCLGNHDTYVGAGALDDIYNKNIAPFAEEYGYEKEGGDVTDKCYYFKDLDEQKLRIIALDIYDGFITANYKARISSEQIDWFIETLASTPAGYGVIVLLHQAPHFIDAIPGKTNFNDTTMNPQIQSIDSDYMRSGKITGNPLGKIIDAFIGKTTVSNSYTQKKTDLSADETISYSADFTGLESGVEFIAFLNGHCHRDFIGYVADCEHAQLNLNVASASPISQSTGFKTASDIMRDSGANQDAFNVYTINRTDKTVGVARIGSNLSKDLRPRTIMFVRYADEG